MHIKVDEDLPPIIAKWLREKGHEASTVVDQGMGGWKDPPLWQAIQAEGQFLITADKGFADIGTGNPAKIGMVQSALLPLDIKGGTAELGLSLNIIEDGQTAQENSRKKSLAYGEALGRPILSIDNALYLEGLSDEEQPGINTRKVSGVEDRASDQALLDHYSRIIQRLGEEANGRWEFAVCIASEMLLTSV